MNRIGFFGGSFDPVHLGHLLMAQAAIEELSLERLHFVPARRSPFKEDSEPLEIPLRLRLLRLALAGHPEFALSEEEALAGGISYTIDTARRFAVRHPAARIFCLVGADLAGTLDEWKEAAELARLIEFAVIPRPGTPRPVVPAGFRCRHLQGPLVGISSTEVRERIRSGRGVDWMLPAAVAEAIGKEGLYGPGTGG